MCLSICIVAALPQKTDILRCMRQVDLAGAARASKLAGLTAMEAAAAQQNRCDACWII